MKFSIGIDLGGTNIAAGIVDENNRILGKASIKTNAPRPAAEIVRDMAEAARLAAEQAGVCLKDAVSCGIGTPGTADPETGIVAYANNLGFRNTPLQQMMEEAIGVPTRIENDANAAAYGESIAGAAKDAKNAIMITLGTGVGGGIIINKKVYGGMDNAGAELGHMVIEMDGEPCGCGRKGCFESYGSATALINQTRKAMEQNPDSALWSICPTLEEVNGKTAFDGMRMGDPVGTEVVRRYIEYLSVGTANLVNIFRPEVFCIGGGICKEGDTLLGPIREYVKRECYNSGSAGTRICVAELGNDAGIIGAAALYRM